MTQRYFMLTLAAMAVVLAAGLYAFAYSLAGRRGRLVLSLGAIEVPHLLGDLFWLFWRGRHAARRRPAVSPIFADLAGAEGATIAGLQVPVSASPYQAAMDEEVRILAAFDDLVGDLKAQPEWLASFHETTAQSTAYRAWVLEQTSEMSRERIARALAAGRELARIG